MTESTVADGASSRDDSYFRRLLEALPAAAYTCDRSGLITYFNRRAREVWGRSPRLNDRRDRFCGSFRLRGIDGAPLPREQSWMAVALRDGVDCRRREALIEHEDGRFVHVIAHASPIRNEAGEVVGAVNVLFDVTEQKRTERVLRSVAGGMSGVTGEAFFARLVENVAELLGVSHVVVGELSEEWAGRCRTLAVWADDRIAPGFSYDLAGGPCEHVLREGPLCFDAGVRERFPDCRLLRDLGASGYIGTPLLDSHSGCFGLLVALARQPIAEPGALVSALGLFAVRASSELERLRDERVRRRLEAKMRQTQKLESLGVLAGGVAHDFNNLLTSMTGYADLAKAELGAGSAALPLIEKIEHAAASAAELTEQMLAYSGHGSFRSRVLSLDGLVREMSTLLQTAVSRSATFHLELEPVAVQGDPSQLKQIVMNLITNASDALSGRAGEITLRTGVRPMTAATLRSPFLQQDLPAGDYAYVEVTDSGAGMTADTLEKIFEPYFTTKFTGRGLGLAAVLGIVRGHHGTLHVCSAPGRGTTFHVLFPVATGTTPAVPLPPRRAASGGGTVLVVEDNENVRMVTQAALERAGYAVVLAADGHEGLEAVRRAPERIDLVLADLTMPRLDGRTLAARLHREQPGLPVILMSGFVAEAEANGDSSPVPRTTFLRKPFRPEQMISLVRGVLGRARGAGPRPGSSTAPGPLA